MTNHPRRQRDDDAPESKPSAGPPPRPAHTPNGDHVFRPDAAKLIGQAVAGALGEVLPQPLYSAFAAALSQVPVQAITQQHMCATCISARIGWENAHRAEIEKAIADAAHAAGVEPGNPQAGRLDLVASLPPDLRPGERNGMPNVAQAVTTVQGTDVCAMHIPGVQAGRTPLLVASAAISPAMLGHLAGAG